MAARFETQVGDRIEDLSAYVQRPRRARRTTGSTEATMNRFTDFHPLGSALIGQTHAENVRHAYVRVHFMNALLQDPRVALQFDIWGTRTGLYRAADRVAKAGDALAGILGLEHRGELFGDAAERAVLACPEHSRVIRLADRFCSRTEAFLRLLHQEHGHGLRASAFVRNTLRLSWSWLAYELMDSFFRHVAARACGRPIVRQFQVVFDPPAPRIDMTFHTLDGETLSQATTRLTQVVADGWRRLATEAHLRMRGRRPKGNAEHLGQYARWFYRHRVQQPPDSVRRLAHEYTTWRISQTRAVRAGTTDDRALVQRGIKEAERLLALGQYELTIPSPLQN